MSSYESGPRVKRAWDLGSLGDDAGRSGKSSGLYHHQAFNTWDIIYPILPRIVATKILSPCRHIATSPTSYAVPPAVSDGSNPKYRYRNAINITWLQAEVNEGSKQTWHASNDEQPIMPCLY